MPCPLMPDGIIALLRGPALIVKACRESPVHMQWHRSQLVIDQLKLLILSDNT